MKKLAFVIAMMYIVGLANTAKADQDVNGGGWFGSDVNVTYNLCKGLPEDTPPPAGMSKQDMLDEIQRTLTAHTTTIAEVAKKQRALTAVHKALEGKVGTDLAAMRSWVSDELEKLRNASATCSTYSDPTSQKSCLTAKLEIETQALRTYEAVALAPLTASITDNRLSDGSGTLTRTMRTPSEYSDAGVNPLALQPGCFEMLKGRSETSGPSFVRMNCDQPAAHLTRSLETKAEREARVARLTEMDTKRRELETARDEAVKADGERSNKILKSVALVAAGATVGYFLANGIWPDDERTGFRSAGWQGAAVGAALVGGGLVLYEW